MSVKLRQLLNRYGRARRPIFFMIDFRLENYRVIPLDVMPDEILFCCETYPMHRSRPLTSPPPLYHYRAIDFASYQKAFNEVIRNIEAGNTYLLNLTFASKLWLDLSLEGIFYATDAKFKLCVKERFVCFSPERFVKISNNRIFTYPMKGTIDATLPNAKATILADQKEMAEHVMVVDLLRNDLAMVSKQVRVDRFRYIDEICAGSRNLLQVSSEISGVLKKNWQERLGDILVTLLPAGSITGTPKKKTTELIRKIEGYERGYFTGIFGYFDGENLDSGVMIRFIEQTEEGYLYKSGGGITIDSNAASEYNELMEKIYVPFL